MGEELSDLGFARLVDAIADAPLVPEWAVDRVADNRDGGTAFSALRYDAKFTRSRPPLTVKQTEAVQALADGVSPSTLEPGHRGNLYRTLRAAAHRLGAVTPYQTVAVAVALGLVTVRQEYALGPAFKIGPHMACRDRPHQWMPEPHRVVLAGVCNGSTNAEIARARGVSVDAVKDQVKDLFGWYGVHSRAHLAALAVRHGHVY